MTNNIVRLRQAVRCILTIVAVGFLNTTIGDTVPPPPATCITIDAPEQICQGREIVFTANVIPGSAEAQTLQYRWIPSAGTISEGQGTNEISVDTDGLAGHKISVKVK